MLAVYPNEKANQTGKSSACLRASGSTIRATWRSSFHEKLTQWNPHNIHECSYKTLIPFDY